MIRNYLDAALSRARYTQLEDGSYGAEVRGWMPCAAQKLAISELR